jgi:hypothetical protein
MEQFRIFHFVSQQGDLDKEFIVISSEPQDDVVRVFREEGDGQWKVTVREIDGDCLGMPIDRVLVPK